MYEIVSILRKTEAIQEYAHFMGLKVLFSLCLLVHLINVDFEVCIGFDACRF